MRQLIVLILLSSVLILIACEGKTMSIGDTGKVYLFSGISGQITLNGEPVKNAILTQKADKAFASGKHTVTATTDETGYFKFEPVFERTISKFLPQEFVIGQHIIASYEGQDYDIWAGVKRKEAENAETGGNPLVVSCDLAQEAKEIQVEGGVYITKCTWNVMPNQVTPIQDLPGPVEDE